jgi:hypothetical protein
LLPLIGDTLSTTAGGLAAWTPPLKYAKAGEDKAGG